MVAWGDYLGLCMATLFKLTRSSRQLTVVSYNATGRPHGALLRQLRVHTHVHAFFYQSSVQMEAASSLLEVPRHKLRRVFHPVDERFWRPMPDQAGSGICAAGLEARDYATLLQAVHDMPVTVHLALASTRLVGPAALRASGLDRLALAGNVRLITPSLLDLRLLYATSRFVVVPLAEVDNDAGATVITEAMAMGKAVILTRNRGQVDIVRDREHGLYVPPRDPAALRSAIRYLLENPDEAERMGRAGRAHIEARHRLDAYVGSLADAAQEPGPLLRQPERSPASQGA